MGKKKFISNTVKGGRKGSKYSETVQTAALFELMTNTNIHQVARKYGVPESTLRGWLKRAKEAPDGGESVWQKVRAEEVRKIAVRAAQDAALTLDLMRRRLDTGARNLARVEEIDRLLLGADKTEGVVTTENGVVIGEVREQQTLMPDFAEKLRQERQLRREGIPADFTLSNYLRTLTAVSARGAAERENESGEEIEVRMDADTEALAR